MWHIPIKNDAFSDLRDFENLKADDDFKFYLDSETNEVDIFDFVKILNRAKKSQYNNFVFIDLRIKPLIFSTYLPGLCKHAEDPLQCEQKAQVKISQAVNSLGKELSQGIRYPYDYHLMDTPESQKAISEAHKAFTSKCPDCGKIRLDHGSQKDFNRLFPLIEKQSHTCLKALVTNMARQLKYHRLPKTCEKNKAHPVCKNMSKNYRLFQDRLLQLTELFYGASARAQTEMRFCSECSRFPEKKETEALDPKSMGALWKQSRNCEEISPGKQKRVSSGTGFDREYTIRREKDGSYSAVLNLQFVAAENYKGSVPKEKVPSHYRDKVQKCLKKANKKMLGPKGEKLRIVLEERSSSSSSCPEPAEVIEIVPAGPISYYNKYVSDIECPDIIHEVLHQTGLCDEYPTIRRGYIIDSKTGEPIEMIDSKSGKPTKEIENVHAVNLTTDQDAVLKHDCRVTQPNSLMARHYDRWNNVFLRKTKTTSLLTPRQFSAILYGDCKSRNQLFNECSQLAYKTSIEDRDCLKKRQKCERQNALGSR
ncbi:MAG: hypothetical protein OXB86_03755 [Bdellovibrionales bacterium]|nr:hypothetical protein [Bdellovibrionales bacterium]